VYNRALKAMLKTLRRLVQRPRNGNPQNTFLTTITANSVELSESHWWQSFWVFWSG